MEMRWVPCSKQLPEKEGYYLTTTMYGEVYCDHWSGADFDRSEMVIAWMPLPAPYTWKEEKIAETDWLTNRFMRLNKRR